jgi:hypothetical protein
VEITLATPGVNTTAQPVIRSQKSARAYIQLTGIITMGGRVDIYAKNTTNAKLLASQTYVKVRNVARARAEQIFKSHARNNPTGTRTTKDFA